ncbi:MAG TPA: MmcQ/YjbR family DNA-binding protein, partial [Pseudomonadales bacterium]|nr:MmcQ/YjbR family DNA-binding protein [Pseudomonadales bacterium]
MERTERSLPEAVAALCTAFPDVEAKVSHGMPTWHVDGRHFATFSLNHHGDGRVALLLKLPRDQTADLIASDPDTFFVPAYTGGKGWVGIALNREVDWNEVVTCARDAWRHAAPSREMPPLPDIAKPRRMKPEEIDPFL